MTTVTQSTQFAIKELTLITSYGSVDITSVFEELSLFENIMTPCMSGSIVIRDAVGLSKKLLFQGGEFISVNIEKSAEDSFLSFVKLYRVYKLSNRKTINQTSEVYTLHFVSEEFLLSEQKKINQVYNSTYSEAVKKILVEYLKVPDSLAVNSKSGIFIFEPSKGINKFVVPNLSPFDAINWISKRSIAQTSNLSDYIFYQTQFGYSFVSLNNLLSSDYRFIINFKSKNIDRDNEEFLGARDFKVIKQFNTIESVQKGVYASKFIGIDPLTRRWGRIDYKYKNFEDRNGNANKFDLTNSQIKNIEGKQFDEMHDSKVSLYVNQKLRQNSKYIRENDLQTFNLIDNAADYLIQRKFIFGNFLQKVIRIVMPGNFGLFIGSVVYLDMPLHGSVPSDKTETVDETLSGKYMITAVRHIIRYDRHETIIDVATDTSEINYKV